MPRHHLRDLKLTPDGDLAVGPDGDLALAEGADFIRQSVQARLRSVTNDWFYDHVGADLEDFLGRPNTREVAGELEARIVDTLTGDGLVAREDVYVRPVPVETSVVLLFVFVKTPHVDAPLGFEIAVDLQGGVTVAGV